MKHIERASVPALLLAFFFFGTAVSAVAVEVGEKAPDFELNSTKGDKLKLSGFAGKKNVVIQFYVLDFTPT